MMRSAWVRAVIVVLALLLLLVLANTWQPAASNLRAPAGTAPAPDRLPAAADTAAAAPLAPPPAAGAPTDGPAPTPAAPAGTLAFALRRNGHSHLYALPASGGAPVRLTAGAWDDRDPAWSPDGRSLAFASHRDGNWELYVLDLATGATRRVTRNPGFDAHPAWSPDGAWLAFESIRGGNLDVYVTNLDGSQVVQVTGSAFADYAPAWSPDGRRLAYLSWRGGNRDVWLTDLDRAGDDQAVNLTQSPALQEERPAWAPDGRALAYAGTSGGYAIAYRLPLDDAGRPGAPVAIGQGEDPAWAPGGQGVALAYAAGPAGRGALTVVGWGAFGTTPLALELRAEPSGLSWTAAALPEPLPAALQAASASVDQALFAERLLPPATPGAPFALVALAGVTAPAPQLSDRVDDAFAAWRARVQAESGVDYLGELDAAWLAPEHAIEADDGPQSWHVAGRAVDTLGGDASGPVVVVREDGGLHTYWRVWLRAAVQDGTRGEPLVDVPWDFTARYGGARARADGGAYAPGFPTGDVYYVDVTALAADYGWQRVPAGADWRANWSAIRAWHFERADGLAWRDALLEIYSPERVTELAGPP